MKVFDATAVIAFLGELDYPEGLRLIATRHDVVLPMGVVREIRRDRSKKNLKGLLEQGSIRVVEASPAKIQRVRDENPALGQGECEVLAFAEDYFGDPSVFLICDDSRARNKNPNRRFVWTEELIDYMEVRGLIDSSKHTSLLEQLAKSGFFSRTRRHRERSQDFKSIRR
jgi:predicted nucleic acid-binding protein